MRDREKYEELKSRCKKAEEALKKVKEELEIQTWGLKKSNEGIKLLYKELEQKNRELQRLDQLKSDFVSTVSHELRTPLTIIKESLSLMLDEIPGKTNEKQRNLLKVSEENLVRLNRIIDDLLDISKIEAGKVELKRTLVDFSGIVKNICEKWKLQSNRKHQDIQVSVSTSPVNIYIDPDKITQVLNNLISNAIKYTPGKGTMVIKLEDKKDRVDVSVTDSGMGIAKENLPKVFSKFQQFSRRNGPGPKGTGLGLAITKELVEMHRGTIRVESELNKGSKFIFSLPKMDVKAVFKECINSGIEEAVRKKTFLSLVAVRVTGFDNSQSKICYSKKRILLGEVEEVIKNSLRRQADTVVKDTEEIIVLLSDTSREDVLIVKERIEKAVNAYIFQNRKKWPQGICVTLGNATYPDEAKDSEELLNKAEAIECIRGKK